MNTSRFVPMLMGALVARFFAKYQVTIGTDAAIVRRAQRLRYWVYCRELGFEKDQGSGREVDPYDAHAVHCVVTNRATNEDVGTVRIVMPVAGKLPMERYASLGSLKVIRACEVSRLAVLSAARRSAVAPMLYLMAAHMAMEQGCTHALAVMEPRLASRLTQLGFGFEQVGVPVEHRGLRVPYGITREGAQPAFPVSVTRVLRQQGLEVRHAA